jgi:hypothetical protein
MFPQPSHHPTGKDAAALGARRGGSVTVKSCPLHNSPDSERVAKWIPGVSEGPATTQPDGVAQ